MRKLLLLLLLMVSCAPMLAFAEVECTERPECWPDGSAMRTGLLLVQQRTQAEKTLAAQHEKLVTLVASSWAAAKLGPDERLLAALKSQQEAWLKYRADECELIGALTGAGGSWPSTYAVRCELNHTEQRLRRVRSAMRCIKNIAEDMRLVDQGTCLQQLAPLTNK